VLPAGFTQLLCAFFAANLDEAVANRHFDGVFVEFVIARCTGFLSHGGVSSDNPVMGLAKETMRGFLPLSKSLVVSRGVGRLV
jgi:hypothetical protein